MGELLKSIQKEKKLQQGPSKWKQEAGYIARGLDALALAVALATCGIYGLYNALTGNLPTWATILLVVACISILLQALLQSVIVLGRLGRSDGR